MATSEGNPLARNGGLSYLEIPTLEPRRSADFYGAVLGWSIDRRSDDDIRFSDGAGLLLGRFVRDRAAAPAPALVPIFYVVGLDAAVARAAAHGGEIVQPVTPEGDVRVARLRDPAGNHVGLWELGGG